MRGATHCARRVRALFSSLRSRLGKVSPPSAGDPITQMILGVFSRDLPESKAREALDRLRGMVVDYNELRVIPPLELASMLGDYPDVRLKCEDIIRSLNRIFALNHTISLDHLGRLTPKEVRQYLDRIDGLEAYSRARIRLLGLRQHAIPLDEAMWAYARQEHIVDPRCPLDEAQGFLERQIAEEDATEFVALLKRQAWGDLGPAVRRREVKRILSVPPDRTTRNMLQLVGTAAAEALEAEPLAADDEPERPMAEPTAAERSRRAPVAARKSKSNRRPVAMLAGRNSAKKRLPPTRRDIPTRATVAAGLRTGRSPTADRRASSARRAQRPTASRGSRRPRARKSRAKGGAGV